MKPFPLLTLSFGSLIFITGCDDGGSLRQQLSRSETDLQEQRDELRKARTEITELKEKLNSKSSAPAPTATNSPAKTSEPAVVTRESADTSALPSEYISAVKELESKLKKKAGSIGVTSFPRTIFAGFTATVEGKKRGVAIPFFSEQDGATWVSSYTDEQILAELQPAPQSFKAQPSPPPQPPPTTQVTETQTGRVLGPDSIPRPPERPTQPQLQPIVNTGSSNGAPSVLKLVPAGSGSQGNPSAGGSGNAASAITNGTPMGAGGDEVRPNVKEVGGKSVLSFPKP